MTDEKLAALESRLDQQEAEVRAARYENECLKQELDDLRTSHETLTKDHALLSDDFFALKDRLLHLRDELEQVSVLAGNSANILFPGWAKAWEEIDRALGLRPKSKS